LWVVIRGIASYRIGDLLCDRFLLKSENIVLDTQPDRPILIQTQDSHLAQPYLKLFSQRPHIPQPYSLLNLHNESQEILLLEEAPISHSDFPEAIKTNIKTAMPLGIAWSGAGALRQLNWLWQIARLWQPLVEQGVASTLLKPQLIRVEGLLVRLLELHADPKLELNLAHLGRAWQMWLPGTHSQIEVFFSNLCRQMLNSEIETADQLIERIDRQIENLGRSQSLHVTVTSQSDQGSTRSRNEDACYGEEEQKFAIVCDGMGGHAKGDVASSLAVSAIARYLQIYLANSNNRLVRNII
jgi:protein phosphatase